MMIHSYKDGTIRVIVTTGNLVESDWLNRCQGIWVSPALPSITNSEKYDDLVYDSPTRFKRDLLLYLEFYKLDILKSWVQLVKKSDFSQINTFFVASVPGSHEQNSAGLWGLGKVEKVLKNYLEVPSTETNDRHSLIYQCSSIGSLGSTIDWFIGELTSKLSSSKSKSNREKCDVDLVYPTTKNVISSYGGVESGCCLPYSRSTHKNQTWLGSYFKQWKSDARYRTRAVPHIKTYCRLNSRKTNLLWFLLTSANCSKAAWGKTTSKGKVQILSYEAGVMFLPKFTINKESMPVGYTADATGVLPFPMPYDVPLVPYEANDTPWFIESVFR